METINLEKARRVDFIGISLSALCGIHCLITPILVLYMPVIGETIESSVFHTAMIALVVVAFYQSIYKHFKLHRSKTTLGLGVLGVLLFGISYLNEVVGHSHEHTHGYHEEFSLEYIAILGAVLLITSHILNMKKCNCFKGQGTCGN